MSDALFPRLVSLEFPDLIDLSQGDVQVTFAIEAEFSSDVQQALISFDRNLAYGIFTGDGAPFLGFSTPPFDSWTGGRSSTTVTVYGSNVNNFDGPVNVTRVTLRDVDGRETVVSQAELASLGIATSFELQQTALPSAPPRLISLDIPEVIDLSAGDAEATFTIRADFSSEVQQALISFDRNLAYGIFTGDGAPFLGFSTPPFDSWSDGSSTTTVTLYGGNQNNFEGGVNITRVTLRDVNGGETILGRNELEAMGVRTSFEIIEDAAAGAGPRLIGLEVPAVIDLSRGDAEVTFGIEAEFSAEVEQALISFDRNLAYGIFTGDGAPFLGFSTPPFDSWASGTSSTTVTFYEGNVNNFAGPVTITRVTLRDVDGRETVVRQAELEALGVRTSFDISLESTNAPASITGDTAGAVTEDDPERQQASGVLTVTDPDAGEERFREPEAVALQGTFGSFAFDPVTGAWSYTLDNDAEAVQALPEGEQVTDSLTVTSLDGTASETITVTITGSGVRDPDALQTFELSGMIVDRAGNEMPGTTVTFRPEVGGAVSATTDASGRFGFEVEAGIAGRLDGMRAHSAADPSIGIDSAVNALRLALGLAPSWGTPATPMDFIAADFNGDGQVGVADAVAMLRHALGLPAEHAPRWVFLADGDNLSGIGRNNSKVESGLSVDAVLADVTDLGLIGILVGHVQEYV